MCIRRKTVRGVFLAVSLFLSVMAVGVVVAVTGPGGASGSNAAAATAATPDPDYSATDTNELLAIVDGRAYEDKPLNGRPLRLNDVVLAAEVLKTRGLAPEDDAKVRYRQAWALEKMTGRGQESKPCYEELVSLHPDSKWSLIAAVRLGQLHDYIGPGTTDPVRNPRKAIYYNEFVVSHTDPAKVYYEVFCAHRCAGLLYWDEGQHEPARTHFEAAYNMNAEVVEPLPSDRYWSAEELEEYRQRRATGIQHVKQRLPACIVGCCVGATPDETRQELVQLKLRYPLDAAINAEADKAIAALAAPPADGAS